MNESLYDGRVEAIALLERVCRHLLEYGQIDEGTAEAANLFDAARALGAFATTREG